MIAELGPNNHGHININHHCSYDDFHCYLGVAFKAIIPESKLSYLDPLRKRVRSHSCLRSLTIEKKEAIMLGSEGVMPDFGLHLPCLILNML